MNSVSFSLCSCAFRRGRKFALKIDYVSILLVWEVDLSALSGVIYLHSIARFLFYHMVIFIWHSRKRHRNFQGIPNFGSSRKTRISKTFAKHRSIICPLETPTRIQVTYFKLPARISRYVKLRLRKQSRTRRLISIEIEVVTRQCLKNCKSF